MTQKIVPSAIIPEGEGFNESGNRFIASSFDELCALGARLFGVGSSAVLLTQSGVCRLVAGFGLPVSIRSFSFDFASAPYSAEDAYILQDAQKSNFAQTFLREFGLTQAGSFIRVPLEVTEKYTLALVLFGATPIPKPTPQKLKLLAEIAEQVKDELKATIEMLVDPDNNITVAKTLHDIKSIMANSSTAAFLLNSNLKVIQANETAAKLTQLPIDKLMGLSHEDIAPNTADAVQFLYKHALESLVSPPDFEVVFGNKAQRVFRVSATPFSPTDIVDYFLLVFVEETTDFVARASALASAINKEQPAKRPKDPSHVFLMDTLVHRRAIKHRKDTNYVVLRSWRQSIKPYQITALKALKQNIPLQFANDIAQEIATEVNSLFGTSAFKAIV
ncbi:MAG: PAS domain-containing protein, partial [Notoacmeibacter sp.]